MVKASFWMLVGIFLFTFTAALAKIMASEGFGVWEIVFWRSIVGCLFCAAVMRRKGISLKTRYPVRYVVRCTVGTVSIALSVYTLTVMPIATAQTLTNTGPLWFCVFLAIAAVINIHTIKPLDTELIVNSAKKTGKVVTAEEHTIIGGLGGAVCEALSEKAPTPILRIGINDVFGESGTAAELVAKYGLDGEGIYTKVKEFVK